ncbi:DUF4129 domain-containing protein [Natribaculum luteum]|uniref:DUF4129 domain-containing protein n=1 Tax=Natribaculum luteum TaxID=1586232 RepID=A0ABD5P0V5_9EURY|nr:DUF4129 domain-containing protein [Natribaculum luteum]
MVRVNQSDLFTVFFTLCLIGSVGVVAATIDSVVLIEPSPQGGEPEIFEPGGETGGEIEAGQDEASASGISNTIDLQFCVRSLQSAPAVLGILSGLGLALYGVKRLYNSSTAALVSSGVLPIALFAYFVLTNCPSEGSESDRFVSGSDVLGTTGGLGTAPSVPPTVVVFGAASVVLLAFGALFVVTRSEQSFDAVEADDDDELEVATDAIARSAGRAADRIERADVPVDNSVYRAWREMTALLNMENPQSAPPTEFARRAIDLGLDKEQVTELTNLFRDVRYGEKDAMSREDRAIEILREIEREYQTAIDGDQVSDSDAGRADDSNAGCDDQ